MIAAHVIHLIGTFCLDKGIGHIGVPDVYPSMQKARSEGGNQFVVALVHKLHPGPWFYHREWIRRRLLLLSKAIALKQHSRLFRTPVQKRFPLSNAHRHSGPPNTSR
jgi:hypothetical protein